MLNHIRSLLALSSLLTLWANNTPTHTQPAEDNFELTREDNTTPHTTVPRATRSTWIIHAASHDPAFEFNIDEILRRERGASRHEKHNEAQTDNHRQWIITRWFAREEGVNNEGKKERRREGRRKRGRYWRKLKKWKIKKRRERERKRERDRSRERERRKETERGRERRGERRRHRERGKERKWRVGRRERERGRNGRQEEAKLNKKRKTDGRMEGREERRNNRREDGRNKGREEGRTEGRNGRNKQPNIVFILVDDLGYNDVPWHNPDIEAATLLKLARKGVVLESHYVLPLCTPSRAALLTGLYPFRIGMQVSSSPLSPTGLNTSLTLLPQQLKQLGYSTHLIGKWHLGYCDRKYTPTERGFDSFYGFYLGSQTYYTRFKRLPESLHKNNNNEEEQAGERLNGGYDFRHNEAPLRNVSGIYSADLFASRAESIIANHPPSTPLFLLLSFQSVHSPLDVPQSFMRRDGRIENPARRTFHGMVRAMDGAVRRVVQQLKAYNLYHNTIIVFTTDNGGNIRSGGNNFPLRGTKGSVFEGGTRGPAFIHSPLLPHTGFKYKGLMHIVDWYETLLHVARFGTRITNNHQNRSNYMHQGNSVLQNNPATPQNNVSQTTEEEERKRRNEGNYSSGEGDGINMWSAILENRESPRTTFVYNLRKKPLRGAIRRRHWKLIMGSGGRYDGWVPPYDVGGLPDARCCSTWFTRSPTPPLMLFNIKNDPLETTDLAALYPDVVATLTSKLRAYSSTAIQPRIPPDDPNGHPSKHGGMFSPGWCTAIR